MSAACVGPNSIRPVLVRPSDSEQSLKGTTGAIGKSENVENKW